MKIKRLEIKGFKSFPDKTVLEFKPGICGIVGPNGCGKSNVFEAIRWTMGEQRARTLRSKKMEDVIFNGSESRKPVGMAEVKLVLSNTDGQGPPSMSDYEEIMIGRRLFRDGESQYEINNISCRLADVTDFFLDTGVGKNSYAIIEQGRVDMVVASKPEDRRILIEEAAGISRYKSRKEAALKKLESTRQNLTRINDVIAEVKRQSTALKRQASRAEKYRKLSERLRELDLNRHARMCRDLQEKAKELKSRLEEQSALLAQCDAAVASSSAQLEVNKLKSLQTEKALKDLLESRHSVELELSSVRSAVERDRGRTALLKERLHVIEAERRGLEQKLIEIRLNHDTISAAKAEVLTEIDEAGKRLKQVLSSTIDTDRSLSQEKKRLDGLKEDIFRLLQETAQQRNRREGLGRRAVELSATLAKTCSELDSVAESIGKETTEKEQLSTDAAEIVGLKGEATAAKTRLVADRQETSKIIASLRSQLATAEKKLAGAKARLQSLEEMQKDYRVYDDGVRFLMNDSLLRKAESMLGPVAELVEVPPEFQKALTTALGDRLGHIVVMSTRHGIEAANRLEEASAGRSTFIPIRPRCMGSSHNGSTPPGLRRLLDVVSFKDECGPLGEFLLGCCYVVEDLAEAIEIWDRNGFHADLVTKKGELINRYGEITGGSQDSRRDEIFEKRREILCLHRDVESTDRDRAELVAALKTKEESIEEISGNIEQSDRLINELSMKEVRMRKDIERLDSQIANSKRRLQVLRLEKERLQKEQEKISGDRSKAATTVERLETRRSQMEKEREQAGERVEQLTREAGIHSKVTGEMRVKLAQLEERGRSLEREYKASSDNITRHEKSISGLTDETARNTQEAERLDREIAGAALQEQELMKKHEAQAVTIQDYKTISEELAESVRKLEATTADDSKRAKDLRERTHDLEMESVRAEQALEGLVEKILERYQTDPRTVPAPEILPNDAEIEDLRSKIESMGEVNLAAIAESRQIEERLTFLREQADDLQQAVDSLYATINAINKTTKARFRDAFDSVNTKFQEIFPFLFKGGEARLQLTDEEDLLETGVDIMARPPGKRIQNMDLLSGGEKALTAVALIFSIFLTRPSPFCLLDEVDAPLDDSNLGRFNEMLKKLSDQTQFLVITHNKRSMAAADSLYGVTMEELGASRVVSVEFMD
jgi:chromosome segregation protein